MKAFCTSAAPARQAVRADPSVPSTLSPLSRQIAIIRSPCPLCVHLSSFELMSPSADVCNLSLMW